ncbi:HlyD family efflux transporter periplasmic adaptor subunit [Longibacter sp.]|uniref:HlyD family efflux transporter periplasmic adaptor subunit n=1 Tax=Longibacter sp. TaxID=2045415 RepID=UPI003EBE59CA
MELPDIPDTGEAGTHFVTRIVGITFAILVILAIAAVLVGLLVKVDLTVEAQGVLEPMEVRSVRATGSADVVDVSVATGDTVAEGTVLVQLDGKDGRRSLRSPMGGVIRTANVEGLIGRRVRAGDTLIEVADVTAWRARLAVSERTVQRVEVGDSVRVDVLPLRSERKKLLPGTVRRVGVTPVDTSTGNVPRGASGGTMYQVDVHLDSTAVQAVGPSRLRDGYSVQADIITRRDRALSIVWSYLNDGGGS